MSKMIRVESCGECNKTINVMGVICCKELEDNNAIADIYFDVTNLSKILPNCPLEDYPTAERDDTKEG